ncbi:MAG TPA: PQQ-dependent sugar dehydrogenase [Tepidisphaeraceae bacterium]|nr:PQQ-dependent sugar dehydrogenase [Tepidisphaeraceae bacterium]
MATDLVRLRGRVCPESGFGCARGWAAALVGLLAWGGAAGAQLADPIVPKIQKGPAKVELTTIASGLVSPLLLTAPSDGTNRKFVVEQTGQVYVIENGAKLATPFLDLSARLVSLSTNYDERGFLGLTFDPGFSNPASPGYRRVFTYTSEPTASGTTDFVNPSATTAPNHHSVIASWRVNPASPNQIDPSTRAEILRMDRPQSNHNGGTLAFGADGMLYVASGDGGGANDTNPNGHNSTIGNGQDNNVLLGKILRIDPNGNNSANGKYGIPGTNPFAVTGGAKEIFASGFRNPFQFSFDGGNLYVGDVGQDKVEEIDKVEVGKNYGWRYKEGTFRFDPLTGGVFNDSTGIPGGLTDPIAQYDHDEGISIIGGFVYRGSAMPGLVGKYVFGDFSKAFNPALGRLFYADLSTGEIRELQIGLDDRALNRYVKGFGRDADGELYVMTSQIVGPSGTTGVVYQLTAVPEPGVVGLVAIAGGWLMGRRTRSGR